MHSSVENRKTRTAGKVSAIIKTYTSWIKEWLCFSISWNDMHLLLSIVGRKTPIPPPRAASGVSGASGSSVHLHTGTGAALGEPEPFPGCQDLPQVLQGTAQGSQSPQGAAGTLLLCQGWGCPCSLPAGQHSILSGARRVPEVSPAWLRVPQCQSLAGTPRAVLVLIKPIQLAAAASMKCSSSSPHCL